MVASLCEFVPPVRVLSNGSGPPADFVMRPAPVYRAWIIHYHCFPIQYHQESEDEGKVWLWIPKENNRAYERGDAFRKRHIIHERRWCKARIKITFLKRGKKMWFSAKLYFTVVSSIHSVLQSYPSRRISYVRSRKGNDVGVLVRRTQ